MNGHLPHLITLLSSLAGTVLLWLAGCFGGHAWGAGIMIMEQSAKELGQAFSGATTNIDDGSAVFFNPAAMAFSSKGTVSLAGYAIVPETQFRDGGSRLSPRLGGVPLRGSDGGDGGVTTFVPHAYAVYPFAERWVAGLGANSPFGVHSRYESGWQGRYQALDSEIRTVNLNPSLAFKIDDTLSIGAGINVQYLDAVLSNAVDFGSVCLSALAPPVCGSRGLLPQQADGRLRLEGDSVGIGYNLGILYAPTADTRLGASYRSRIRHELAGDADYAVPAKAVPLTRGGAFIDTKFHAPVTLPDSVAFGIYHRFSPRWAVTADALWTHWSLIQSLDVNFSSSQPASRQALDWRDSWRVAIGLSHDLTPGTTLRLGLAYDQSPIAGAQRRTPRIPDSDRVWLTAGASFKPFHDLTVHGGYAHLFFQAAPIKTMGPTGDVLVGRASNSIDIVGIQFDWRF